MRWGCVLFVRWYCVVFFCFFFLCFFHFYLLASRFFSYYLLLVIRPCALVINTFATLVHSFTVPLFHCERSPTEPRTEHSTLVWLHTATMTLNKYNFMHSQWRSTSRWTNKKKIHKPEFKWINYDTYRYASACAVRFECNFSLVCMCMPLYTRNNINYLCE